MTTATQPKPTIAQQAEEERARYRQLVTASASGTAVDDSGRQTIVLAGSSLLKFADDVRVMGMRRQLAADLAKADELEQERQNVVEKKDAAAEAIEQLREEYNEKIVVAEAEYRRLERENLDRAGEVRNLRGARAKLQETARAGADAMDAANGARLSIDES